MTALALSLQDIIKTKLAVVVLPDVPPKIDEAYRLVKQKLGDGPPVQLLTPKESEHWVELGQTTFSSNSWSNLKPHDIKNISLCLWYGDEPLAKDEGFLESFLATCQNNIKKSLCRALIWVYLHNYEYDRPGISLLGDWLVKFVNQWDWPWADKQKELFLFSGKSASRSVSKFVMSQKGKPSDILESCGLAGSLQSGGAASSAFFEMLNDYKSHASSYDFDGISLHLKRVMEWAALEGQKFSYPRLKTHFIESLLLPWIERNPNDEIINLTQSFLIDLFGDPRLGGASWKSIDEKAMRIIRGWLVKRALAQFLDVVDETAPDQQWKYRRAFWMAYYNKGVITDAWVAFGKNGANKAEQIARRNKDNSWLSFGHLFGSGDSDHAVLILRIGNMIVADFSHNGKCRLWDARNERAPKPYNKNYDRADLTNSRSDSEYIHSNSSGYLWQGRVASEINNMTGIKVIQREYTPR